MERCQVMPPHAQTQLWLSFSNVLAYIFQFNLIGFNEIWSVPNVLQLCNHLTWSFHQRLHKSKLCKPAVTLAPSTCDTLLLTDLSKWRVHLLAGLENQVNQMSTRNGSGVLSPALDWKNGLPQAIATQFSEISRKLYHLVKMVRLLDGWQLQLLASSQN